MTPKRFPSAILATCPVPWTEAYTFDETLFRTVVRRWRTEVTPYLYIFGTAGEGYAVTDAQFEAITRAFVGEMPAGTYPMVGVISLSLGTIIERITLGRALGARLFQISLPAWGALTDSEVDHFFRETCGRFPDCQFLHYNLARTKRLLTGTDYARLSQAHPNLVAIKMGGEDTAAMADVLAKAPALQCFFTDFGYAALRDTQECGFLMALSAVHLGQAKRFFAARGTELAGMLGELRVILHELKSAVGAEAHMDGAYDKLFIKLHEPSFPLRLLPPYTTTSDATLARFRASLPAAWRNAL